MVSIRKFDLSLKDARKICEKYRLDPPSKVNRLEKGMVNDVFSLDKKYVIKIKTGNPEIPRFRKEKEIYDLLRKNNLPVPKIYAYDNSKNIIPYTFILMDRIYGENLGDLWKGLSDSDKDNMLVNLGKLLAQIHSVRFSQFGEEYANRQFIGPRSYKEYFGSYLDEIVEKLRKSGVLSEKKITKLANFYHSPLFDLKIPASLTHGNFIYDNIIVEDEKINAIVDWEWARATHNEDELATVLYRVLKMDKNAIQQFRSGYESVIKLDDGFETRLYAYVLLYYLKVLPYVPEWKHRPDKQKEYYKEIEKLIKKVIK